MAVGWYERVGEPLKVTPPWRATSLRSQQLCRSSRTTEHASSSGLPAPPLQLLPTMRFVLRKKVHGSPPSNGDGTAVGPQGVGLEDLPSCTPAGDEVFLADLGYRAPGPYELCIASAPQVQPGSRLGCCGAPACLMAWRGCLIGVLLLLRMSDC